MDVCHTHTGKIYVDRERKLEFLTVGDYGKENNIKADFLGLHKEIHGVQHHDVDLSQKWVATISTQKGCPMRCQFCDCPKFGFHGNVTRDELAYEVETILQNEDVKTTDRFNVHFARMGEPTWNKDVLAFAENDLRPLVAKYITAKTVHPVVSIHAPEGQRQSGTVWSRSGAESRTRCMLARLAFSSASTPPTTSRETLSSTA